MRPRPTIRGETGSFTLTISGLGDTGATTPEPDPTDSCGETLTADGTTSGEWASGCESTAQTGSHARYYGFSLAESSAASIVLESSAGDTYLYLREGDARSGAFLYENDDDGGITRSKIEETLAAGSYTIEATTYNPGETGSFTLTVSGLGETAGPEPGAVTIGTTVEAGGSSYTVNVVMDPAPPGIFGVEPGKRLVALDITQVGINASGDSYNRLDFAVQDSDGYLYTLSFASADVSPSFVAGTLAAGQIIRGWVVFELPQTARLVSVSVEPELFEPLVTIADLSQYPAGNLVSQTRPPVPEPPLSPVAIRTTVEAGGSSYTVNAVMDPAPPGIFGVESGKRLVALDITQVGINASGDSYNRLDFAVQDSDGYLYTLSSASADVSPSFGSGILAAGQITRGWVVFELPQTARLVSVSVEPELFEPLVTIADLIFS